MDRNEHLAWAKARALELVALGDLQGAFASFTSDLNKHEGLEAESHIQQDLGFRQLLSGQLDTGPKMHKWIEGFN